MNEIHTELQWSATNAPAASSRTDDIWFLDALTGWAVNSNGQILKTTDGFETWQEQRLLPGVYLRCIGFADALTGWVGTTTASERLYHTRDGGQTWEKVENLPATAPSAICGLSVVNASVVYASGTNYPNRPARMIKTTDGGQTWTGWEMAAHASLLVDTFFTSPERGWVVGGKGSVPNPTRAQVKPVVLYTEDGGRTWENRIANLEAQLPFGEWGWKIQFLNDSIGFVSLENFTAGAILKTTDGGRTWERKPINDAQGNANLEGVGFIDEHHGWVGGWGNLTLGGFSSETFDGGDHWRDANEIGNRINRFLFVGNPVTVGYASGRTVYKYSAAAAPAAFEAAVGSRRTPAEVERAIAPSGADISFAAQPATNHVHVHVWDRFGADIVKYDAPVTRVDGSSAVHWDLKDASGDVVPPGHYIIRLQMGDATESCILRLTE